MVYHVEARINLIKGYYYKIEYRVQRKIRF